MRLCARARVEPINTAGRMPRVAAMMHLPPASSRLGACRMPKDLDHAREMLKDDEERKFIEHQQAVNDKANGSGNGEGH